MLDRAVIDSLFSADLPDVEEWERRYPARSLPDGAKVTRLGPSPTGHVHIGTVYVATIDRDVSSSSGGVYLVRVEDTDQLRLVDSATAQFDRAFSYFGIASDEDTQHGDYGPYQQSRREQIYHSYARELLRQDKAYLCFATKEDLADSTERQRAAKLPTGYYGQWAIWRDADPADVQAKLDEGAPWVVRFRTPAGADGRRVSFVDSIRGRLSAEDNRNDAVILKASDQSPRLPTYHFAHAVDDHLMRVNLVIRGDEWISSVPLHLQLFDALGFEQVTYAHIAPLMKVIPGGKRKLSKRKDDEANVDWYMSTGYPAEAVSYYLRGLANGKLAELPLPEALATPIQLEDCGVAGPLVDLDKLTDISADFIASLDGPTVLERLMVWAHVYDSEVGSVLEQEPALALRALAVEREGTDNPRKDLRMWSDFRSAYGFFFPALFEPVSGPADPRLVDLGVPAEVITAFANDLVSGYQQLEDPQEWFGQIRGLATEHGFAKNAKEYKKNPEGFPGSIREASQIVRVALTGSTRSPDMQAITQVLGVDEVLRRLRPLSGA